MSRLLGHLRLSFDLAQSSPTPLGEIKKNGCFLFDTENKVIGKSNRNRTGLYYVNQKLYQSCNGILHLDPDQL